jgi:hypothetical protein
VERIHTGELYDLYSSLNIIRLIKSRRVRWTENVARMRYEVEVRTGFHRVKVKEGVRLEDHVCKGAQY